MILRQQDARNDCFSVYSVPNAYQSSALRDMEDHSSPAQENPLFYVSVYAVIGFLTVAVRITWTAMQYTGALYASRTLFSRLLRTVVHAVSSVFSVLYSY